MFVAQVLAADPEAPVFPRALSPGDTITIVAPAGELERERIEVAVGRLQTMGFKVKLPSNLYRRRGYLAGTDQERADEVMAAFKDPQVKAIFCGAGGFGTTRMLDMLDYDVIRQNPKILTGFSDITGLHLGIHRRTGLVTFHSPVASYGLGTKDYPSAFSLEWFWRALLLDKFVDGAGQALPPGYEYKVPSDNPTIDTLSAGTAQGRLVGGNLSLVCALMGTPYEIQTEGRILFLEDRNEEPYRVDRFLSQLRLGGKLTHVTGVVLGVFVDCDSKNGSRGLSLGRVFRDYFEDIGVPVISGFPVGHYKYNATLPIGVMAELDTDHKRLRLLENPVSVGGQATSASGPE